MSKLHGFPLAVPSLALALVQRSKGSPISVIELSLELREKAKRLRVQLGKWTDRLRMGEPVERFGVDQELKDLIEVFKMDIGLKARPELLNAIDIELVLGLPAIGINLGKIRDWSNFRSQRKKCRSNRNFKRDSFSTH